MISAILTYDQVILMIARKDGCYLHGLALHLKFGSVHI